MRCSFYYNKTRRKSKREFKKIWKQGRIEHKGRKVKKAEKDTERVRNNEKNQTDSGNGDVPVHAYGSGARSCHCRHLGQ